MIPKKLLEEIIRWISEKRYGHLQINFSDGKIVNINRVQSIKVEELESNYIETRVTAVVITNTLA